MGTPRLAMIAAAFAALTGCRSESRTATADTATARVPAQEPPPPESVITGPLQPGDFALAGVSTETDSAGVIAALGRPDSVVVDGHPWDSAGLRQWRYGSRGLVVALTGTVHAVTITGPATATSRGVRVGDPVERVRAAYGDPHGGLAGSLRYDDDSDPSGLSGMEFRTAGGRVTSIHVGYGGFDNAPPPWEWARPPWFISGEGVGPITRRTTEQDLIREFGRARVDTDEVYPHGEGEYEYGTRVLDSLIIRWNAGIGRDPAQVLVLGSAWRTRDGIGLGTTLEQLEELNGRPFTISGWLSFGPPRSSQPVASLNYWSDEGRVCSWEGGRLATSLRGVDLFLTSDSSWYAYTEAEREQLRSSGCRPSSLGVLRRFVMRVDAIRVSFRGRSSGPTAAPRR